MLPSIITLNAGAVPADFVFADAIVQGSTVTYVAPSAQLDLLGRPSLRFSTETTKAGIERTLYSFNLPEWSVELEKYVGNVTLNGVLTRRQVSPIAMSDTILELQHELLAATLGGTAFAARKAIASARF
jgi:hypothetical protein